MTEQADPAIEILAPEGHTYASVAAMLAALGPPLAGAWIDDGLAPIPCAQGTLFRDTGIPTAQVGFGEGGSWLDPEIELSADRRVRASPSWYASARQLLIAQLLRPQPVDEPIAREELPVAEPIAREATVGEGPFESRTEAAKALGLDRKTLGKHCKRAFPAGFLDRTAANRLRVRWETLAELRQWHRDLQKAIAIAQRDGRLK